MVILIFKQGEISLTVDADHVEQLRRIIQERFSLHPNEFFLISNGRKINDSLALHSEIHLVLTTLGGKGGFGSILRNIQIEKTTNNEACRDLNGRRLRDINNEKRIKNWLEKKKEVVKEDPDEKFNRKIEKLQAVPKVEIGKIDDVLMEDTYEAVEQGLKRKAVKSPKKTASKKMKIKGALWIDNISSGSESDDDD